MHYTRKHCRRSQSTCVPLYMSSRKHVALCRPFTFSPSSIRVRFVITLNRFQNHEIPQRGRTTFKTNHVIYDLSAISDYGHRRDRRFTSRAVFTRKASPHYPLKLISLYKWTIIFVIALDLKL